MKMTFGKSAGLASVFLLGLLLGPLLVAAGKAALASEEEQDRFNEARKLISAYQTQLPPNYLFLSIILDRGRDCGYDPEQLFPATTDNHRRDDSQLDFLAPLMIEQWEARQQDELWLGLIADGMVESSSPFTITFLRHCIEDTIFSSICVSRVSKFDEGVKRFPAKPSLQGTVAKRAYCTFMDGVAARRGIPLVTRKDQATAN